ncbi:hypothetical protein ACRWCX_22625 [Escherichia coli]|nr:hypothetical protein D9K54_23835 [Escherichia coli]
MQDNDDVSELDIATREVLILRCNLIQLASEYIKINPLKNTRIYTDWICPYISRHLLSLNPLLACCRRYSRGER